MHFEVEGAQLTKRTGPRFLLEHPLFVHSPVVRLILGPLVGRFQALEVLEVLVVLVLNTPVVAFDPEAVLHSNPGIAPVVVDLVVDPGWVFGNHPGNRSDPQSFRGMHLHPQEFPWRAPLFPLVSS